MGDSATQGAARVVGANVRAKRFFPTDVYGVREYKGSDGEVHREVVAKKPTRAKEKRFVVGSSSPDSRRGSTPNSRPVMLVRSVVHGNDLRARQALISLLSELVVHDKVKHRWKLAPDACWRIAKIAVVRAFGDEGGRGENVTQRSCAQIAGVTLSSYQDRWAPKVDRYLPLLARWAECIHW